MFLEKCPIGRVYWTILGSARAILMLIQFSVGNYLEGEEGVFLSLSLRLYMNTLSMWHFARLHSNLSVENFAHNRENLFISFCIFQLSCWEQKLKRSSTMRWRAMYGQLLFAYSWINSNGLYQNTVQMISIYWAIRYLSLKIIRLHPFKWK